MAIMLIDNRRKNMSDKRNSFKEFNFEGNEKIKPEALKELEGVMKEIMFPPVEIIVSRIIGLPLPEKKITLLELLESNHPECPLCLKFEVISTWGNEMSGEIGILKNALIKKS